MTLPVAAICAGERVESEVRLSGAEAKFKLTTPAEPDAVVVDPDWEVLVARDAGDDDAKQVLEAAMKVANDTDEANAGVLTRAIADLRGLLARSALSGGEEGAAHTGLGRCLFRLGQLDEKELVEALRLGAGGPFHRGWAHLRLGPHPQEQGRAGDGVARGIDDPSGDQSLPEVQEHFAQVEPFGGRAVPS